MKDAVTCMENVAKAVAAEGVAASFQPAAEPARYPVLEHLSGRRAEEYMDITKLGTTEKP